MSAKIQIRRDTALNWTATNPVLAQGEPGLEIDTNKVKYGTGSTAWNLLDYASGGSSGGGGDYSTSFSDGVNDNTWHFVEVTGKKEFTFETQGYKIIEITLTTSQVADIGNANLVFLESDIPQMADLWFNKNTAGNEVNMYTKTDYDSNNFSSFYTDMTNPDSGVYVFPNAPVPFAEGDKIVIKYWTEGSTYNGGNYDTNGGVIPDVSSTGATNQITFDSNEYPGMPWTAFSNPDYAAKHSIVFTDAGSNDNRNITAVVDNGNGTYTATFDGTAKATFTTQETTFTFTEVAAGGGWYITIPTDAYPTFGQECHYGWNNSNTNKYTGGTQRSGWITINGGGPINFNWYNNSDSQNRPQVNLFDYTETAQGDVIEVHFYKQLTTVDLSFYNPNPNNWNNGHKWFDWKDDIATEYSPGRTNGILSGRCQFIMKNYVAEENDFGLLSGEFGWIGSGGYSQSPYDPYRRDYMSDWGDNANYNAYPFYRFDTDAVVFYSDNQANGSFSRTMKVRIMYRFKLEIGEDDQYWYC